MPRFDGSCDPFPPERGDREPGYCPARCVGVGQHAAKGVTIVYGVIRSYSGSGAKELMDLIVQRQEEVEGLLRGVTGFVSYALIQSDDGGATVTVCQDKAGADESIQLARDWVAANAGDLGAAPPTVTEGSVGMHLT